MKPSKVHCVRIKVRQFFLRQNKFSLFLFWDPEYINIEAGSADADQQAKRSVCLNFKAPKIDPTPAKRPVNRQM